MDIRELKEIQKRILKAVKIEGSINPKIIAGFDIVFTGDKAICTAVVIDCKTKEILERAETAEQEIAPYSALFSPLRTGIPALNIFRKLKSEIDLMIISEQANPGKMSAANYIGIMANKPSISISKEGILKEDRILHNNRIMGYALKSKPFAKPIYVLPGHKISPESALEIIKSLASGDYKLPSILHEAHKMANRIKKNIKSSN